MISNPERRDNLIAPNNAGQINQIMPNALLNNSGVRFLLTDYSIPSIDEMKTLVAVKTALRLSSEKLENRHRVNIAKSVVELCLRTDNAKRFSH